mmetsp:Transcript_5187/g.7609  ORF Transcript_5187/g.7609 Transcript_5187/m.7609 type:complete len:330 (+) Transcript_5187:23-1012(+)
MSTDVHPPPETNRHTLTSCSFSRNWLLHVAEETVSIANTGKYVNQRGEDVHVGDALQYSIQHSKHYHFSHVFRPPDQQHPQKTTKYYIMYGSSIEAAAKMKSQFDHIGILNSASSRNPGGKFSRGTVSQEDCICRVSLLYACLVQYKDKPNHYYQINNTFTERGSSSSCAIFSPRVPVIREDSVQAPLLDTYQECSFVTIPATNAFVVGKQEDKNSVPTTASVDTAVASTTTIGPVKEQCLITLRQAMRDRLYRALCIFAENQCTDLILCAFGCGVHGNNPTMVAEIFKDILNNELQGCFNNVVFAIQPSRHHNYKAFTSVFPEELTKL